ncbi:hypothetical protein [Nocardia beijingensis]|uniref:Uncharacterized protein n=1 Tax=Nocardia beijingensis TaxID=95162 RepID=A0ABW7WQ99_9NOCA
MVVSPARGDKLHREDYGRMPRWAIVVEETTGSGEHKRWSPRILTEVVGTRAQALAKLAGVLPTYTPEHPKLRGRRIVLRDGDTYLLMVRGWSDDYHCIFRVWEMVSDSDRPEIADCAPDRLTDR